MLIALTAHTCDMYVPTYMHHTYACTDCTDRAHVVHVDSSIHGSIEQKITDFPLGFEGQWVARMGVPMNTVRCLGLSPTFATLGGS